MSTFQKVDLFCAFRVRFAINMFIFLYLMQVSLHGKRDLNAVALHGSISLFGSANLR